MMAWYPRINACIIAVLVCSCSSGQDKPALTPEDFQEEPQVPQLVEAETDEAASSRKIKFDLQSLDEDGLFGPSDGKRALDYEFKIPKSPKMRKEVSEIDPSVKFMPGSRGRIGASKDEILCIGSTNQPRHKEILLELAALPYIDRIIVCHFE